jgi:hypothetical protein
VSENGDLWEEVRFQVRIEESDMSPLPADTALPPSPPREWTFDRFADRMGWEPLGDLYAVVTGGSLWLAIPPPDPARFPAPAALIHPLPGTVHEIQSPPGLKLPATEFSQVEIRLLNLSPGSNGYLAWFVEGAPETPAGTLGFTMQPENHAWQTITIHTGGRITGVVDRIRLGFSPGAYRGDLWVDSVRFGDTPGPEPVQRPDVVSTNVIPEVTLPGIRQEEFADAFAVLDECLVTDLPAHGFPTPVMGPGGAYGPNWWQLDSSLNLAGAKWANQSFAEDTIRGFMAVQDQNPDGRIDLWGGAPIRGLPADLSSIPRYFEVAFNVARRSCDRAFQETVLRSMADYLNWWLSPVKRDPGTGLVTAIAEETFAALDGTPQAVAAVDLNVAVAVGAHRTAELARRLGDARTAVPAETAYRELRDAINRYLWDSSTQSYRNYDVREQVIHPLLVCTTFDPLCLGIAPEERVLPLLEQLIDPTLFNWGLRPVTSIAMTEAGYVEATGPYDGRAWFGDVWTMRNLPIIQGLRDVGRHQLAAELAWQTVQAFNANYCEYVVPSTGAGEGVQRYGWSASQYIQTVIEHVFGVDWDANLGRLQVFPHLAAELHGHDLRLERLWLPTGPPTRITLALNADKQGLRTLTLKCLDAVPESVVLEVALPELADRSRAAVGEAELELVPVTTAGTAAAKGVRVPLQGTVEVRFE